MDWDDSAARGALIEAVGLDEYARLFAEYVEASTVARVGGHAIRPVKTRYGRVFIVDGASIGFLTQAAAETWAQSNPADRE